MGWNKHAAVQIWPWNPSIAPGCDQNKSNINHKNVLVPLKAGTVFVFKLHAFHKKKNIQTVQKGALHLTEKAHKLENKSSYLQ